MIFKEPSVELFAIADSTTIMKHIERIARECWHSQDKITDASYGPFIRNLIDSKHDAMLEHFVITLKFDTDRGVTHEMVRHRVASYAQTSTRYVNYSKEKFGSQISVVKPFEFDPFEPTQEVSIPMLYSDDPEKQKYYSCQMNSFDIWMHSMMVSEWAYMALTTQFNRPAQLARSVLPNSTATTIFVTANFREWRHILNLRAVGTTGAPHPDMKRVMTKALNLLYAEFPIMFSDIHSAMEKKS